MIKDSGERQVFESGAVRDISKGKGRCDLMPLDVIGTVMQDSIFTYLEEYKRIKDNDLLGMAIGMFIAKNYNSSIEDAFLDLSIHFEEGAEKYGIDNWKGLPEWTFLSSAVRHYLKFKKGMTDENHGRAFMWNIVCLMAVKGGCGMNVDTIVQALRNAVAIDKDGINCIADQLERLQAENNRLKASQPVKCGECKHYANSQEKGVLSHCNYHGGVLLAIDKAKGLTPADFCSYGRRGTE